MRRDGSRKGVFDSRSKTRQGQRAQLAKLRTAQKCALGLSHMALTAKQAGDTHESTDTHTPHTHTTLSPHTAPQVMSLF